MSTFFTFSARVYWCPNCNVPVLDEHAVCGKCGGTAFRVKVTPPGDVRPVMPKDYEITIRAIEEEFGDRKVIDVLFPRNSFVLLNKIPYPDEAEEIIAEGQVLAHRFYDPVLRRWRIRPVYAGVARMIEARVGYWAIVDLPKLARKFDIHKEHVIEGELPHGRGKYIAVATKDGKFHAIAESIRPNRYRVLKAWKAKEAMWIKKASTLKDVLEANENRLEYLVEDAKKLLKDVGKLGKPIVVSFSGGKDSLVVVDLASKVFGRNFYILFNDTGLELPETLENVREVVERYGVEFILASAGKRFFDAVKIAGPPARDYRWCCKVVKMAPIARAVLSRFPDGFISVVGQRMYESIQRARIPKVSRSSWIPKTIVVAPINEWVALDVWLYIWREKLPYNKAYEMGFDRIGCWLCPACELAEFELIKEFHPDMWSEWESILKWWGESHGKDERLWLGLGTWRWRKLPGDIERVARIIAGDNVEKFDRSRLFVEVKSLECGTDFCELRYELREPPKHSFSLAAENARAIVGEDIVVEPGKIVCRGSDARKRALEAFRALIKSLYCLGCGLCSVWCPEKAIKVVDDVARVDASRCRHCYTCNNECPITRYHSDEALREKGIEIKERPLKPDEP